MSVLGSDQCTNIDNPENRILELISKKGRGREEGNHKIRKAKSSVVFMGFQSRVWWSRQTMVDISLLGRALDLRCCTVLQKLCWTVGKAACDRNRAGQALMEAPRQWLCAPPPLIFPAGQTFVQGTEREK